MSKSKMKLAVLSAACFFRADELSSPFSARRFFGAGNVMVTVLSPLIADTARIGGLLGGGYDSIAGSFAKVGVTVNIPLPLEVLAAVYLAAYGIGWVKDKRPDIKGVGITVAADLLNSVRVGLNYIHSLGRGWSASVSISPYYHVSDYVEISGQVLLGMASVRVPEKELTTLVELNLIKKTDEKFTIDRGDLVYLNSECANSLAIIGDKDLTAALDQKKADLVIAHQFFARMDQEKYKQFVSDVKGCCVESLKDYLPDLKEDEAQKLSMIFFGADEAGIGAADDGAADDGAADDGAADDAAADESA